MIWALVGGVVLVAFVVALCPFILSGRISEAERKRGIDC
jgi:hypothetical protein